MKSKKRIHKILLYSAMFHLKLDISILYRWDRSLKSIQIVSGMREAKKDVIMIQEEASSDCCWRSGSVSSVAGAGALPTFSLFC